MKAIPMWKPAGAVLLLAAYFYLAIDIELSRQLIDFFIFQARDIDRAMRLLAGQPLFFGPEMTGGGNLPGPF